MPDRVLLEYAIVTGGHAARARQADSAMTERHESYTASDLGDLIAGERERVAHAMATTLERLRQDPGDYRLYLEAGRQFFDDGSLSEALAFYRKGLAVARGHPELLYRLAQVSLEQGKYRRAGAWLRKSLEGNEGDARCLNLLGKVYVRLGSRDRARAAFERAVIYDRTRRPYRLHLAKLDPTAASALAPPLIARPERLDGSHQVDGEVNPSMQEG
jgi:Flp pilus assembly protein TadD